MVSVITEANKIEGCSYMKSSKKKVKEGKSRWKLGSVKAQKSEQVAIFRQQRGSQHGKAHKEKQKQARPCCDLSRKGMVSILELGKQASESRKGHRDRYVMLQDSERPGYNKEEAATRATEGGGNGGLNWRRAKESREAQVYMVVRRHSIYRQWSGYEP